MKRCTKCGITKPVREFNKNRSAFDGKQVHCKACFRAWKQGMKVEHQSGCGCKACVASINAVKGLKLCAKCGRIKPFGEFYKDHKMRGGLHSYCKSCESARVVADARKRKYRMTPQDLQDNLVRQNGLCASCGDPMDATVYRGVAIDHDHKCCPGRESCGKCIRGLLCMSCNLALGMIKDDPDRALALAAYLMRFQNVLGDIQWA